MLNIAVIGYGQMGQMLEKMSQDFNCRVVKIFDPKFEMYADEINEESLAKADVCLDFSLPETVPANAEKVASCGKDLVIGTTGWYDQLSEIKSLANIHGTGIIYGGNFSLGMNLFLLMTQHSSQLISQTGVYDVFGYELHHNKKADSPSGTAKELAETITESFPQKETAQFDRLNRKITPTEFHFASVRGGSIPGTHVIGFDSVFDTIELKHTARSREGFAAGALKAAHWIRDKKGFYEFRKIFPELIRDS